MSSFSKTDDLSDNIIEIMEIENSVIDTTEAKSQLECWDDESKELRTPKHLLQYIHRLKVWETFTLHNTKHFGRVSFNSK